MQVCLAYLVTDNNSIMTRKDNKDKNKGITINRKLYTIVSETILKLVIPIVCGTGGYLIAGKYHIMLSIAVSILLTFVFTLIGYYLNDKIKERVRFYV